MSSPPNGLQQLLYRAAMNETFREALLERRAAAATDVVLTASERAMVESVPRAQLEEMIRHIPRLLRDVRPSTAAAGAAILLGGAGLGVGAAGCDSAPTGQSAEGTTSTAETAAPSPLPTPTRTERRLEAPGGAVADMPPEPALPPGYDGGTKTR